MVPTSSGTRGTGAGLWGRRIAAGLAAAALSAAGGVPFLFEQQVWTIRMLVVALGLVAVATVVGTLWSGKAIGLALGAAPLSIIFWIAVIGEADSDAFWAIAGLWIMFLAFAVSAASWGLTLAATRKRREGLVRPDAA